MDITVSHLPKIAREEQPDRPKTPGFPLLIGILVSVGGILVLAVARAVNLGIFG
jgi:hypothetical protein